MIVVVTIIKTSSLTLEILIIFTSIVSVSLPILEYNGNDKTPAFVESSYSPHLNTTVSRGSSERARFSPMVDPSPLPAERRSILEHTEEKTYLHGHH
jgi:hypothetical protein